MVLRRSVLLELRQLWGHKLAATNVTAEPGAARRLQEACKEEEYDDDEDEEDEDDKRSGPGCNDGEATPLPGPALGGLQSAVACDAQQHKVHPTCRAIAGSCSTLKPGHLQRILTSLSSQQAC